MKFKFVFTILTATLLFACTKTDPNLVKITGEITNPIGENVAFRGNDTSYTTTLSKENTFEISFRIDSPMYLSFQQGPEVSAMYVKPGDNIRITIDTKQFDETIKYEGSVASNFLANKYLIKEGYDFFGEPYYLGNIEEYRALLDKFKTLLFNELNTLNDSLFVKSQKLAIEENITDYAKRHEEFQSQFAEYGQDARIFAMERNKLNAKYNFYAALDTLDSEGYDALLNDFRNDVNALINNVTDTHYVTRATGLMEKQISSWKERKVLTDNMPKAGEPAVDFTYPDIDGNDISLSTLQGKLVYVDVWATWCGPCLGEIPSLQKLEEEYQGKNISFLSVSVDDNKENWMKMVTEDHLGGIQIWANGFSQITKDYAIFGIPRFMLFSADGMVISADAPRPSSGEIRGLLDENL